MSVLLITLLLNKRRFDNILCEAIDLHWMPKLEDPELGNCTSARPNLLGTFSSSAWTDHLHMASLITQRMSNLTVEATFAAHLAFCITL